MAREFIDGFEVGTSLWTGGTPTLVTASTYGMDGSYAVRVDGNNNAIAHNVTARDAYYGAFMVYGTSDKVEVSFFNGATQLGLIVSKSDDNGHICWNRGGSIGDDGNVCVDSGVSLTYSTMHRIQFYYLPRTDSSGRAVVMLDGTTIIDFTGQTANTTAQITKIALWHYGGTWYFDNVIMDDSAYPGVTYIQGITVTGAGSNTTYTPSTGSNYTCVDEIPPSAVDYVYTDTANNIDTYTTSDVTGTLGTIKVVQVQIVAFCTGSTATPKMDAVVRVSSAEYSSTDIVLTTVPVEYVKVWELDPSTSVAWATSGINAMEIGMKAKA